MTQRCEAARQLLRQRYAQLGDALLIEEPHDLFYLTGCQLSAGSLLIAPERTTLFVDGRYEQACRQKVGLEVAKREEALLLDWLVEQSCQRLLFDSLKTSYSRYALLCEKIEERALPITMTPLAGPIAPLRAVKDAEEIASLKAAARLCCRGLDHVSRLLHKSISEKEVGRALELFWLQEGGEGVSFEPIIAFGPNSALPHHRPTDRQLGESDIALIDLGVQLHRYQSDMTRCFFVGEKGVAPELKTIYQLVKEAQQLAQNHCKAGIKPAELDRLARDYIAERGYGDYFTHNLGHGVGLEIHEPPWLRRTDANSQEPLQAGMVVTIEPGIYLPGIGGVRLENSLVVEAEGSQVLTCYPM